MIPEPPANKKIKNMVKYKGHSCFTISAVSSKNEKIPAVINKKTTNEESRLKTKIVLAVVLNCFVIVICSLLYLYSLPQIRLNTTKKIPVIKKITITTTIEDGYSLAPNKLSASIIINKQPNTIFITRHIL